MDETATWGPPRRLTALLSWQAGRVSTLGARLTAQRMPLPARADFAVLAALDQYGELSQAQLGRHLGLDRNDVNAVVSRLHHAAAVRRDADPADRRRNVVAITPVGNERLLELEVHAAAVQDELLAALSAPERAELNDLMTKVLSAHGVQSA